MSYHDIYLPLLVVLDHLVTKFFFDIFVTITCFPSIIFMLVQRNQIALPSASFEAAWPDRWLGFTCWATAAWTAKMAFKKVIQSKVGSLCGSS